MEEKWCNLCEQMLPLESFVQLKSGKPYSYCKPCHANKNRTYYLENREEHLAYKREYREKNREWMLARDKKARLKRKIQVWEHYGNGIAACACCGVSEIEFLTLDHIAADGADHRKFLREQENVGGYATGWFIYKWLIDNGYPKGYQTLCFNCNVGKHRTGVNKCPHELQRQTLTLVVEGTARTDHAA